MNIISKVFVVIIILVNFGIFCNISYAADPVVNYGYELKVNPVEDGKDVYFCEVIITNLDNGDIIAKPAVVTQSARECNISIGDNDDNKIVITILPDKKQSIVSYTIKNIKEGKIINFYKGTIKI